MNILAISQMLAHTQLG